MAIVSNPLIGRTKQSAGNMTFTKWKDRNVLKNKATEVANPKSPGQQRQRNAFKLLIELYPSVAAMIQTGFKEVVQSMTVFNKFVSLNIKNGTVTTLNTAPYTPQLNSELMVLSAGTLLNTDIQSAVADISEDELVITWPTATSYNQAATDRLAVYIINETAQASKTILDAAARSAGTYTSDLASLSIAVGNKVQVITFFYNADGEASDSDNYNVTVQA